jgi:hypothetical protein
MTRERIDFRVTGMTASVPDGVPVEWQGRELWSGPLTMELEEGAAPESHGVLDYEQRRAEATFHVRLAFPELAGTLEELGVDRALTQPVRAVLRSAGEILADHSFALSGRCALEPHELFSGESAAAAVLPGH